MSCFLRSANLTASSFARFGSILRVFISANGRSTLKSSWRAWRIRMRSISGSAKRCASSKISGLAPFPATSRAKFLTCAAEAGSALIDKLKPWRRAFCAALDLPRVVLGPVLASALSRFALILRALVMPASCVYMRDVFLVLITLISASSIFRVFTLFIVEGCAVTTDFSISCVTATFRIGYHSINEFAEIEFF